MIDPKLAKIIGRSKPEFHLPPPTKRFQEEIRKHKDFIQAQARELGKTLYVDACVFCGGFRISKVETGTNDAEFKSVCCKKCMLIIQSYPPGLFHHFIRMMTQLIKDTTPQEKEHG